jgi:hypothetical protein
VPYALGGTALLVIGQLATMKLDFQHFADAARSLGGISLKRSATISALKDDALPVCHLIADFRSHIELMLSRTRVGITPRRGSGIFRAKKSRMLGS